MHNSPDVRYTLLINTVGTLIITMFELCLLWVLFIGYKWIWLMYNLSGWELTHQIAAITTMVIVALGYWILCGSIGFAIHMGYCDMGFEEDRAFSRRKLLGPFYSLFTLILGILEQFYPEFTKRFGY